MGVEDIYRSVTERADMERALLLVMILSSGYMIWESYNFSIERAARFPRLTAGAVLIGSLLLFFQDYLPAPIRPFVAEEVEMLSADEEVSVQTTDASEKQRVDDSEASTAESEATISTVGRPIHDSFFTALSTSVYALLGYVVGILWVSPLFVLAYTLWFRRPWYQVIGLSVLAFLIGYGFMSALNVPLNEGEIFLTDGLGVL